MYPKLKRLLQRWFLGAADQSPPRRRSPVEGDVDLVVREHFFSDPNYRGIVIEVGAAKPDYLSISASFRRSGWHTLAIEPNRTHPM
jgi:hypothetical protein